MCICPPQIFNFTPEVRVRSMKHQNVPLLYLPTPPQAGSFNSVDFCEPPRGILTLDEDVVISKNTRPDGDLGGAGWLVIQGGGQRWKLSSEVPGEISRWEEVTYIHSNMHRLSIRGT